LHLTVIITVHQSIGNSTILLREHRLARTCGARMFTPQMIAGSTQKEGTYHFFEIKGTALSLMVCNVGSKWKQKKDAVKTFKISTSGKLVTFTSEIFGIQLMKHSRYALKHCLVDVKGDKRACYATKEATVFATCIRGILEYPYKCGKTRNGVPTWVDHILPLASLTEQSPIEFLLSVYTQIQDCSFGKVSDRPIVCRHCIIPW
jgi:hypothetical protein